MEMENQGGDSGAEVECVPARELEDANPLGLRLIGATQHCKYAAHICCLASCLHQLASLLNTNTNNSSSGKKKRRGRRGRYRIILL